MRFEFDWKGGEQSAQAWRRPSGRHGLLCRFLALSWLDEESGQGEERWVTIGRNPASNLLLVVHTYVELSEERAAMRIIFGTPANAPRNPPI
jgi:hypothetical protein